MIPYDQLLFQFFLLHIYIHLLWSHRDIISLKQRVFCTLWPHFERRTRFTYIYIYYLVFYISMHVNEIIHVLIYHLLSKRARLKICSRGNGNKIKVWNHKRLYDRRFSVFIFIPFKHKCWIKTMFWNFLINLFAFI